MNTVQHGYTTHGHPCCGDATVGERPRAVARCGGRAICKVCADEARERHGDAKATADADRIVDLALAVGENPSGWWFVHAGGTIDVPDEPPATVEARLRGAMYAAAAYHHVTLFRHGHREAVLMSRHMFERLIEGRPEWQPPTFATPDPGEGL